MNNDRFFMWLILVGGLTYAGFLIWLAFYCFWAFAAIIAITIGCVAYAMKHAELVGPDDDKYDKIDSVLS